MMKCHYRLWLVLCVSLGLELAVARERVGANAPYIQPHATGPDSLLDRCIEQILRNPFPTPSVQARLAADLPHALEESKMRRQRGREMQESEALLPPVEHRFMGWTISDEVYWKKIPLGARNLPVNWSRLPVVRFTNTEIGGRRELRLLRGLEYDQWLLSDPERDITACISVHRNTRRVYFMEVARRTGGSWDYALAFDNCYSCHPSGPRTIRPLDERLVDRKMLERFNRVILSYGACDFGETVDPDVRGQLYADARCAGCHNGKMRGRLYEIHKRPILFKTTKDLTMPPDFDSDPKRGD